MSIRRKSTAHDLAHLRLHPDGSRVQQSIVNARHRTANSTVVDHKGNWIAKDAGGKSAVKTRRNVVATHPDDEEGEFIDLSGDEDVTSQSKGKRRARDSQTPDEEEPESERLNTRTKRRLSFMDDLSFLDPSPVFVSSIEPDSKAGRQPTISFPDPASDLLKSIHHFASCYYREKRQLFDSSRDYRGKKRARFKQRTQENIHTLIANTINTNSETEFTETEDEASEDGDGDSKVADIEDSEGEGSNPRADTYRKDMYKAFDGSALMAIGIVLQEYVAHTLSSKLRTSKEPQSSKRRRTGNDDRNVAPTEMNK